jgi:hypothetical protein
MYISAIVETPAPTPEETIPVDTGDPEWWN